MFELKLINLSGFVAMLLVIINQQTLELALEGKKKQKNGLLV